MPKVTFEDTQVFGWFSKFKNRKISLLRREEHSQMVLFFSPDIHDVMHYEFVPEGQTVNQSLC
jgi:hypothetical protein